MTTVVDLLNLDALGDDRFLAHNPDEDRRRVFGGQVVAQALMAATGTVEAQHLVHSLHAYFLRAGSMAQPIEMAVERLRTGRQVSARRVTALQEGKAILILSASFHQPGGQGEFHVTGPTGVPGPEHGLPRTRHSNRYGIEALDASFDQPTGTGRRLWFRSTDDLGDDPALHRAVVAYQTDHGPFGSARRVVDASVGGFDDMFRASLDHAIWFHRPFRADDWLLHDIDAISYHGDRILTNAGVYDAKNRRVATVTQEILARAS